MQLLDATVGFDLRPLRLHKQDVRPRALQADGRERAGRLLAQSLLRLLRGRLDSCRPFSSHVTLPTDVRPTAQPSQNGTRDRAAIDMDPPRPECTAKSWLSTGHV
jgi:hypothetical protein